MTRYVHREPAMNTILWCHFRAATAPATWYVGVGIQLSSIVTKKKKNTEIGPEGMEGKHVR